MRLHVLVVFLLVCIDQMIKYLVRLYMTADSFIELIPNLIHLTYQENQGISFGVGGEFPDFIRIPVLILVPAIVVVGLAVYVYKNQQVLKKMEKWAFALIIAGAIGNLIDRGIRFQVTDYMYFHFFDQSLFVNNFADDLISIGFVLIIWQTFSKKEQNNGSK